MPTLLVVGGGLFGSLAAAAARSKGIETLVFDPEMPGAASPAAAGLFKEKWAGKKLEDHFRRAIPLLQKLFGVQTVTLRGTDGHRDSLLFVSPNQILEKNPLRQQVTAVGDGWLEAAGRRYEGWVYVAAGVWSNQFLPQLNVYGKSGAAFVFPEETPGKIHQIAHGRQAIAFVRDPGQTHFSDGTAERIYTAEHDRQTLARADAFGLTSTPVQRLWGQRPYVAKGPVFLQLGQRTWLATGGRKLGTILGAAFASQFVEEALKIC